MVRVYLCDLLLSLVNDRERLVVSVHHPMSTISLSHSYVHLHLQILSF